MPGNDSGKRAFLIISLGLIIASTCGCTGNMRSEEKALRETATLREENLKLRNEISVLNGRIVRMEKNLSWMKKRRFSILFTGDILLANGVIDMMKKEGPAYPFASTSAFLKDHDVVFSNIETPITTARCVFFDKAYSFALHPEQAAGIGDLGLDVVSLSNNHMMDCGEAGMRDTISALDRMNILHTGAGENLDGARRPVVLQMGDIELVILAYCERPPAEFYADGSKAGIAPFVLKDVISDIKKYGGPDSRVILSLHWGIEQTRMPQPYQVRLAHQLIQAGAEAIIGHHPHWPQGIEVYRNRPIIYSLGNYVNGFCNEIEQDNIFAALHYSRGRMTHVEIIPLAGKNREIRFQPHVLKGKEAHEHLKYMDSLSRPLGTRIIIEKDRGYIKIR